MLAGPPGLVEIKACPVDAAERVALEPASAFGIEHAVARVREGLDRGIAHVLSMPEAS